MITEVKIKKASFLVGLTLIHHLGVFLNFVYCRSLRPQYIGIISIKSQPIHLPLSKCGKESVLKTRYLAQGSSITHILRIAGGKCNLILLAFSSRKVGAQHTLVRGLTDLGQS